MLVKMEPFWQLNKEKEDSELPESTLSRSQVFWARPSPRFPRGESSGMRNPCWHLTLCPQEYNCAARDMILHCWHSLQHKHKPWPWPSNSLQLSVVRQREAHGKKNSETTPFKPLTFTDIHWPCEITSHSTEHHQPVLWLLEPGRWANTRSPERKKFSAQSGWNDTGLWLKMSKHSDYHPTATSTSHISVFNKCYRPCPHVPSTA